MTLLRQSGSYLVVGGVQFAVDWAVFVGLSAMGIPAAPANVAGRVCGAVLGFWLNGRVTFARGGQPRLGRARLARFVAVWLLLTLLSTLLVGWTAHQLGLRHAWLAKPVVEFFMAALGFAAARCWIYR